MYKVEVNPIDLTPISESTTVFTDSKGRYWWSSECYEIYGPYNSIHDCMLDQLTYCHVEL
jgi:hypothetical protein